MRTAETVLNSIRERSTRGLPLTDAYRQRYNPDLYLVAYGRLARNTGALTPGVTRQTLNGMSLDHIRTVIDLLHRAAYRWSPVHRIQIPTSKQPGSMRPLGIPTWTDKLVQQAMRLIVEAQYEPRFSPHSHGFRPARGCHTAFREIVHTWTGTKWFIEGDIKGCFDHIDHAVVLSILAETIPDPRFLRLMRQMLQAGYLEDGV
jgi:retron-type reverse transcriptase